MFQINPLGEALGAEVIGLDPSRKLTEDEARRLNDAFFEYLLLCIRCDPLSAEDFAEFGRQFGSPQLQLLRKRRHGDVPEVSVLESSAAMATCRKSPSWNRRITARTTSRATCR
jgi:taurine dioxygenase